VGPQERDRRGEKGMKEGEETEKEGESEEEGRREGRWTPQIFETWL